MADSNVWNTLVEIEQYFESQFSKTGKEINEPGMERFNQPGWINKVWSGDHYRRAHIDVVDARETKGLWMMHCCVFPHLHNPSPIFGFDVVSGKHKITGCFYDFSPTEDDAHFMCEWFAEEAQRLAWNKVRKLPEWAERIFSGNMIAAGNVSDPTELEQIATMAKRGIEYYLGNVAETNFKSSTSLRDLHNYYAQNQKQNPHTPKVMTSLGLNEEDVRVFIQECLFPEIR